MINQHQLDALDPLRRVEFDAVPVRAWRVTWPDGSSEVVRGHMMVFRDTHSVGFHYHSLGPHRLINLQHVRDVAEIETGDSSEALRATPPGEPSNPPS